MIPDVLKGSIHGYPVTSKQIKTIYLEELLHFKQIFRGNHDWIT